MFDIISFIRVKIFRRPELETSLAWEELSEKQTTKLWYFLLYCMFGAILISAQWTLSIIKELPTKPTNIPYCVNEFVRIFDETNENNNYWTNYSKDTCILTSINPEFDFTNEFNTLNLPFNEIISYKSSLKELINEKKSIENKQENTQKDYNTSLTEKIANENSWQFDTKTIQNSIENNSSQIDNLNNQISKFENNIKDIQSKHFVVIKELKVKIDKANDEYKTAYLIYKLYVAILSFIFAIIVFSVLYRMYVKQKIKNSPHTIIFSVATFAYWIVILQISALFIWDIIPHKLIELIKNLLSLFTPLVYLVQFLWPLIIIAIFWFMVFRIQKRLYSPQNVLKRFISDKKCPNCWNSVDFTKPYCPLCSYEVQIHCPNCHELTLKWMPYCSNCWWNLQEKDIITYWNNVLDEALKMS